MGSHLKMYPSSAASGPKTKFSEEEQKHRKSNDFRRETAAQYTCDKRGYINFVANLIIQGRYRAIQEIGKGTFSRVMKCEDLMVKPSDTHRLVALKINRNVDKYKAAAKIEYEILQTIKKWDKTNKSNCAHLLRSFEYYGHKCFVFPLFGRSVYGFLSDNRFVPFALAHVKQFAWQIIAAMKFMHDCKIIFTDLKPENLVFEGTKRISRSISSVLPSLPYAFNFWKMRMLKAGYTENNINWIKIQIPIDTRLKVIDFGSALFEAKWHNHLVQTRHYRAPEVVLGMRWKYPIDIWSIGCIMLEFIYGRMVFNTHDSIDHLNQMITMIGPMPKKMYKSIPYEVFNAYFHADGRLRLDKAKISAVHCKPMKEYFGPKDAVMHDLVSKMLRWDPKTRITCEEALRHPYFADVDTTFIVPKRSQYHKNLSTR